MRTLPAALAAAVSAGGQQPTLSCTVQDLMVRLSQLCSTGFSASTRTSCILTSAGTLLRAAVAQGANPNTLTIYRVTDPTNIGQWQAAGNQIATTARAESGCCLVQTGGTIRCFYINHAALSLVYRDSTNDGVTWGAETTAKATPASQTGCAGIMAASTTEVYAAWYVYRTAASNLYKITYSGSWSAWSSAGPSSPQWGELWGLALDNYSSPYTIVAGVQMRALQSGIALASTTLTGTTWTAWSSINDMDTPDNGTGFNYPTVHHSSDGYWYAGGNYTDTGAVTGSPANRCYIWRSSDGTTWVPFTVIAPLGIYEVHVFVINGITYAFDNGTVFQGPSTFPSSDVSNDVLDVIIHEKVDDHQSATITLSNESGQYNGSLSIRDNATVALYLGYNGTTVQTHSLHIDAITYDVNPDLQTVTLHCRSSTKLLEQPSRVILNLTNQTVGAIAGFLLRFAGITNYTTSGTTQFSTHVPSFVVTVGEPWHMALRRLGSLYDFDFFSTLTHDVVIQERLASDASTWTYGTDALSCAWQTNADQPNVIRVVGAPPAGTTTNIFAEVTDNANLAASGAHRYEHIVDRMCDTAAKCLLKA